jgi:hypothetical protein
VSSHCSTVVRLRPLPVYRTNPVIDWRWGLRCSRRLQMLLLVVHGSRIPRRLRGESRWVAQPGHRPRPESYVKATWPRPSETERNAYGLCLSLLRWLLSWGSEFIVRAITVNKRQRRLST